LLQQNQKDVGHLKSAVMLLGRLLMASLFVFVGYTQVRTAPLFLAARKSTPIMATLGCCTHATTP